MRTILSIVGARPQFIKHAALHGKLKQHVEVLTLHTGQHYDDTLSGIFFKELKLPRPHYQLDITHAITQSEQTGRMMAGIEEACAALQPDAMLLYGDTNSTLAGALVAAKLNLPSIHVEAGIRSYNRTMPEEVNRIITDTFATILCCPIPQAVENLRREGIHHEGVYITGDVMCDMLELARPQIQRLQSGPYYFATIHRPYNTDNPDRMRRILATLNRLEHPVIFPIHPRTADRLKAGSLGIEHYQNIRFTAPIGYLASISYQDGATCIITDSGSIQKEAYMLRKKCITLRSETEWNETLEGGWNTLVFEDIESIVHLAAGQPGKYIPGMFGTGHAAAMITDIIVKYLM